MSGHNVRFSEKITYGSGDFASCLYFQTFMSYLMFFYTDVFGITALAAGAMIGLSRAFDAFFDPTVGMVADRTNTRWGKYRPYLLWFCVPIAIAGVLTFTTPEAGTVANLESIFRGPFQGVLNWLGGVFQSVELTSLAEMAHNLGNEVSGKLIWALLTYNVLMLLYTAINIPYTAMLGVISPDSNERTSLSSIKFVLAFTAGNHYDEARLIPKQVFDATYLINVAPLKAHSSPHPLPDGMDEGMTGVSLTGKNQFGSIKAPYELHDDINTYKKGTAHAYSPIVDLEASPNLGRKTILYVLEALYCAKRHQSYPLHFPNPPFNNRVTPYANPEWPSSLLTSMDGVAIDSVGVDILYSQTKNNEDENHRPRILLRENSDDYLQEEALADHPPSGTRYRQNGKPVPSLGVFEHWDSDATRQYTRNQDPKHGNGIELIYLPLK